MISNGVIKTATIVAVGVERLLSLAVDPAAVSAALPPSQPLSAPVEQVAQVPPARGSDVFGGARRAPPLQLSPGARQFNAGPTRARLIQLAEQSPGEARGVFSSMLRALETASAPQSLRSQLSSLVAADDAQLPRLVRESALLRTFSLRMPAIFSQRWPPWPRHDSPVGRPAKRHRQQ